MVRPPFAPREVVRRLLRDNAQLFAWSSGPARPRDAVLVERPDGWSARLTQEFKGLPVDVSEVIVNVTADGRSASGYNQYHYDIPPALDPARIRIGPTEARARVARLAARSGPRDRPADADRAPAPAGGDGPPRPPAARRARARFLAAVRAALARARRPPVGTHVLAWDVTLETVNPRTSWRVLLDATTGRPLEVRDLVAYAQAPDGSVFDPNPIVTSGNLGLSSRTATATLNAQRVDVTLLRLDPAPTDGRLRLDGAWVHMDDFTKPTFAEPARATGHFVFGSKTLDFLDVMVYFHVDRFQDYRADRARASPAWATRRCARIPQGENGADGSTGGAKRPLLRRGRRRDASDAMIILHEYGHFLQDAAQPGSAAGNFPSGVAEGFCDFLAAVYDDDDADPPGPAGYMFSWDANPVDGFWQGRRYDSPLSLSGDAFEDLAAATEGRGVALGDVRALPEARWRLEPPTRRAAARDLAIRLHLVANGGVPRRRPPSPRWLRRSAKPTRPRGLALPRPSAPARSSTPPSSRRAVEATRPPRGISTWMTAARVDTARHREQRDSRRGCWKENHGEAPDVWVSTTAVPGTPADHVPRPPVGVPAFVFARVKNRGAAASGPITVKAFSSPPGSARAWPTGLGLAARPTRPHAEHGGRGARSRRRRGAVLVDTDRPPGRRRSSWCWRAGRIAR